MSQVARVPQAVKSRTFRRVLALVGLLIIAVIAYIAYTATRVYSVSGNPDTSIVLMTTRVDSVPENYDTSTTRASVQGLFRGSWVSQLDPINIDQIHTWTFHLETADGQPLENAQITVDGGMPQHGHGLPTQPEVTQYLGQGNYRVEGMKFQMAGWWVVNFHITANGKSDTLQFNLMLK